MASTGSAVDYSSYSDKQVASSIDHGKEVVTPTQPYPDAYAYANPNNTNNDSTHGGSGGGGLEAVHHLLPDGQENPAWVERKTKRKICGLSSRAFIIAIAVVTALLVAAIIGGSIGGVLAHKNNSGSDKAESAQRSSTSPATAVSATATATATAGATTSPSATVEVVPFTFSSSSSSSTPSSSSSSATVETTTATGTSTSSTSISTASSQEGTYNCPADNNEEYVSSVDATATWTILCNTDWPAGVAALSEGTVYDLDAVIAYSVQSCIDQCVENNLSGGGCQAVVYGANITLALSRSGITGNCFLKNDRGAQNSVDNSGQVEAAYASSLSA
ncbi:hypothetical protein AYL99_07430 [Fonsecaea erecta]|uniref:Apple domain-containing protein n=1 Tax=Fonsecaea erecta TaxID=1367422 RepID=A0A178ZEX4_9EURO|nr:hypothetical protein AYL99_07430 [Fonsecaea erecta]OAP58340.1 hypothetical protein AYL99_07430 [Fonsecaea erecta]